MKKLLFRLLAVFFFVAGLLAIYSGYLYRSPQDEPADGVLIPVVADIAVFVVGPIAKQSQFWAFDTREMLGASNHGLLPILAAVGILALILGVISLIISISAKEASGATAKKKEATGADKASSKSATGQTTADALDDAPAKTESSDDAPISISIGKKDADTEADNKQHAHTVEGFEDINQIISLSYSHLSEDKRSVIFQKFRPDLAPHLGLMTELAQNKLAKQILLHYVLKHNRSGENIDSSQFRAQDTRMNETERETIMRRFLPQKPESVSADAAKLIGNVYEITEQPDIQHKTFTEAEDWQDVSLRNALDMFQMPAPGSSNDA